jgi:hypothetical protein
MSDEQADREDQGREAYGADTEAERVPLGPTGLCAGSAESPGACNVSPAWGPSVVFTGKLRASVTPAPAFSFRRPDHAGEERPELFICCRIPRGHGQRPRAPLGRVHDGRALAHRCGGGRLAPARRAVTITGGLGMVGTYRRSAAGATSASGEDGTSLPPDLPPKFR